MIRDSFPSFLEGYVMLRGTTLNPHFGSVRLK
nr:MAG TPA: hypothetical protein [Caudoviricetes sp.]DAR28737.1 MAG TPA: hypothetical protein [Herelleviridae sp.]